MLISDFNAEESEPCLSQCQKYDEGKLYCTDLFITSSSLNFKIPTAISNGLSDFHEMVIT